jgi:acyl-CoA reductase-like NAD-dependent aldehyde dehydrogenase
MTGTKHRSSQEVVNEYLAQSPIPLFINGEHRPAKNSRTFPLMRPSDGSQLATVAAGNKDDIDDAVKAAAAASLAWASRPVSERAVLLHRLADAIERDKEILAMLESRDLGKPYHEALAFDIGFAASGYRYFADVAVHGSHTLALALPHLDAKQVRLPRGVCGFIIPWNAPFILAAWGCGPALAAGNTVVLKAAELAPLTCLYLGGLAKEVGFAPGVINIVPGLGHEAGAALAAHPRLNMISFTGSPATGKLVASAAAANLTPSKLELGGKGAAVVFPDVNVPSVASQLTAAIVRNAGQTCCTATRWIIHEDIMSDFLASVNKTLESVRLGPDESDADLGAVISEGQRQRIMKYLQAGREQGAKFLFDGGTEPVAGYEKGYYVRPSLLAGSADNVCAREEIFGPVAYVMPFRKEEEAVASVNATSYGLANSVWSQDLARANRVAERMVSGNSWINAHNVFAYGLPYGGVGLSGWGGGVNSPQTFRDYQRELTVARPLP